MLSLDSRCGLSLQTLRWSAPGRRLVTWSWATWLSLASSRPVRGGLPPWSWTDVISQCFYASSSAEYGHEQVISSSVGATVAVGQISAGSGSYGGFSCNQPCHNQKIYLCVLEYIWNLFLITKYFLYFSRCSLNMNIDVKIYLVNYPDYRMSSSFYQ